MTQENQKEITPMHPASEEIKKESNEIVLTTEEVKKEVVAKIEQLIAEIEALPNSEMQQKFLKHVKGIVEDLTTDKMWDTYYGP